MGGARPLLTFFRSHLPPFIEAVAWGICLQGQKQIQQIHPAPYQLRKKG
jgi:hypothetical protein